MLESMFRVHSVMGNVLGFSFSGGVLISWVQSSSSFFPRRIPRKNNSPSIILPGENTLPALVCYCSLFVRTTPAPTLFVDHAVCMSSAITEQAARQHAPATVKTDII